MSTSRQHHGGEADSGQDAPVAPLEQAVEDTQEAARSLEPATRAVQVALDRRSGGAGSP